MNHSITKIHGYSLLYKGQLKKNQFHGFDLTAWKLFGSEVRRIRDPSKSAISEWWYDKAYCWTVHTAPSVKYTLLNRNRTNLRSWNLSTIWIPSVCNSCYKNLIPLYPKGINYKRFIMAYRTPLYLRNQNFEFGKQCSSIVGKDSVLSNTL